MSEITQLLNAATAGDRQAAADLLPLVYNELRKLAAARMASEQPGQTLDATALVHEAYLRLLGDQQFEGEGHFFAAAAQAMRRILVDAARRKRREKHGGDRNRVPLDDVAQADSDPRHDLLALDAALTRLAVENPQVARLVELRHFAGLTNARAAQALGISPSSADRLWAYGRAWLHREVASAIDCEEF
jgi:RNA polymerase sigma factor (TIGR02999 family)